MMHMRFTSIVILLIYMSSTYAMPFTNGAASTGQTPHCHTMNMMTDHQPEDLADSHAVHDIEKCLKHCGSIITLTTDNINSITPLLSNEQPVSKPVTFISFQSDTIKHPPKNC